MTVIGAITRARTCDVDGRFVARMSPAFGATAPGQQDGIHFWTPGQMTNNLLRLGVLDIGQ